MFAKRIVTFCLLLILGNPVCCCLADPTQDASSHSSCCAESHSDTDQPADDCDCDQELSEFTASKLDQFNASPVPMAPPGVESALPKIAGIQPLLPNPPPPPTSLPRHLLFEVFLI